MDAFDAMSLHFVAIHNPTGLLVGTVRLILPDHPKARGSSGAANLADALTIQSRWACELADSIPEAAYRSGVLNGSPHPLPIFRGLD